MLARTFATFVKEAISRMDAEAARGTISYGDVVPGAQGKAQARASLAAAAPRTPERLARTRDLKGRVFEAQSRVGEKGLGALGVHGSSDRLYRQHYPGVGPGMLDGNVYVSKDSGRFMRSATRGFGGQLVAAGSTFGEQAPQVAQFANRFMPGPSKQDPTINLAVLQHELGESNTLLRAQAAQTQRLIQTDPAAIRTLRQAADANMLGDKLMPVGSHLGPEPNMRENLGMIGDPKAQATMKKLRLDPGNDAVQKAIRQAGGHPDVPLAIGGRQQRAVERILSRRFSKDPKAIGRDGRKKAIQLSGELGPEMIGYSLPDSAGTYPKIMERNIDLGKNIGNQLSEKKYGPALQTFRGALPQAKKDWGQLKSLQEWVDHGGPAPDDLKRQRMVEGLKKVFRRGR